MRALVKLITLREYKSASFGALLFRSTFINLDFTQSVVFVGPLAPQNNRPVESLRQVRSSLTKGVAGYEAVTHLVNVP